MFDAKAARDSTDALVKIVYNSLFNSLVTRVNAAMAPPGGEERGEHAGRWLGMLDIFGCAINYNRKGAAAAAAAPEAAAE